jgi:hypothetical protein
MTQSPPPIGTTVCIGPSLGRVWHDLGGVRLNAPRHVVVTSHVYRAIERGDIAWLNNAADAEKTAKPTAPADDKPKPTTSTRKCTGQTSKAASKPPTD